MSYKKINSRLEKCISQTNRPFNVFIYAGEIEIEVYAALGIRCNCDYEIEIIRTRSRVGCKITIPTHERFDINVVGRDIIISFG